jgi:hypothetical protein
MQIKKFLPIIMIISLTFSCSKDRELQIKKTGHFLSKVFWNDKISELYNYDKDGNLTELDQFSIIREDTDINKMFFEYNSYGLIQKWTYTDTLNNPNMYEIYDYNNSKQLIKRTVYSLNRNNSKFESNLFEQFSYVDNRIRVQTYCNGYKTGNYFEYEYDEYMRNIISVRYYRNDSLNNLELYTYDDKVNPMKILNLPLPLNIYTIIRGPSYLSCNNIIKGNSMLINSETAAIDSNFSYNYIIKYQYDSFGYPITYDNGHVKFKFEYLDIKK